MGRACAVQSHNSVFGSFSRQHFETATTRATDASYPWSGAHVPVAAKACSH